MQPLDANLQSFTDPERQRIETRAYERFLARGAEHGADLDDWLAAEQDVRQADARMAQAINTTDAAAAVDVERHAALIPVTAPSTGLYTVGHVPVTPVAAIESVVR